MTITFVWCNLMHKTEITGLLINRQNRNFLVFDSEREHRHRLDEKLKGWWHRLIQTTSPSTSVLPFSTVARYALIVGLTLMWVETNLMWSQIMPTYYAFLSGLGDSYNVHTFDRFSCSKSSLVKFWSGTFGGSSSVDSPNAFESLPFILSCRA